MDILQNKKLILGSKSPRRSQLLTEAGLTFEIRIQDVDESFDVSTPVLGVAENLAIRKANALKETLNDEEILLTADSVVILDNTIYNKPENYEDGVRILSALSDRTHTVATGVCLMTKDAQMSFTVLTYITFEKLSMNEIEYYLHTHRPYDKAGAYGIQDWIGWCKVKKIEGSYSNVMGLPVREVYEKIKDFSNEK
jgi:septum formation protein